MANAAQYVLVCIMFISIAAGAPQKSKELGYLEISCNTKLRQIKYMFQNISCFQDDGSDICTKLGLYGVKKEKCTKCCGSKEPTTEVPKHGPEKNKKDNIDILMPMAIGIGSVMFFLIIVVTIICWKYKSRSKANNQPRKHYAGLPESVYEGTYV